MTATASRITPGTTIVVGGDEALGMQDTRMTVNS